MIATLVLAVLLGAAVTIAIMVSLTAAHWSRRAEIAEGLLAQAAKRRSDAVSRGNVTRAALQRAKVLETAAQMRLSLSGIPLTANKTAGDQEADT